MCLFIILDIHNSYWYNFNLESKMTLWKDKVTLQKVGVTSWKDRNSNKYGKYNERKMPSGCL